MACDIKNEFAGIDLGDRRRDERLLKLAARLAESPSRSVHAACNGWNETVAGYRLLHSEEINMQKLLAAHHEALLQRASECADLLLVQDTTELDYSSHKTLSGTGPMSDKSRRGFFLHNRLLIAEEEALVLGVSSAKVWARNDAEQGKAAHRKSLPIEEKESMRWLEGYDEACTLATELPGRKIIMIADRECDIYELYVRWQERPQADFIVRAARDRALLDVGGCLFENLHAAPLLGGFDLEVKRKEQMVKIKGNRHRQVRESRLAKMEVRATQVHPRPPARKGLKLPEVELTAVLVAEKDPPEGQEPIEWLLLTTLPVQDFEQAMRIVNAYRQRWVVEEYHRVLKSGCRVEALTLGDSDALLAAVAIYMVIAWRILYLRNLSRRCGELPGVWFFTQAEVRSACLIQKRKSGNGPPTLSELTVMVAKMGGYLARKSDPPPGAEYLWRGLEKLRCYVEMAEALGAL